MAKDTERKFFNYRNRPPQVKFKSHNPSKVQEGPLDSRSPQEVLEKYGMYRDKSSLQDVKPFYADLTQFEGFADSLNHVRDIKEKFMTLDVDIRAKFNHNPDEFCNYCTSNDFDVREILTKEQLKTYDDELQILKQEADFKEYQKSDEYQELIREQALKNQFYQEKFNEWKKSRGGSK